MPIYLPPISRRRFLAGAVTVIATASLRSRLVFAADADPHSLALMADTHVAADRAAVFKERKTRDRNSPVLREVNMADHLAAVVKEVIAWPQRPAVGLVVGDLAKKEGLAGDYAAFLDLLKPLREAGLPLHLTLGNHDQRDRFAVATFLNGIRPAEGRIAEVLELPRANLFVIDTLDKTDGVPGEVGKAQLEWLVRSLDGHAGKPAIVFGHHHPMFEPPPEGEKPAGLLDTAQLFKLLEPRRHVKAYVYGHTHTWEVKEHTSGIHLVNLPPTSYVFESGPPSGWVHAALRPDGMRLELRCLDTKHATHGQIADLTWRK
jgi:3',5'-cyclic AMP phosphodiesterase CpdA